MISAGLNLVIPFCHYVVGFGVINFILGWADILLNIGKHSTKFHKVMYIYVFVLQQHQ